MKNIITFFALLIFGITKSQTVADFESFSLPADSFYYNTSGNDWLTTNASYQYDYSGGYWIGGFAYTNKNNVDSGNFRHLYNCAAGKGYNLSSYYATGQPGGFIRMIAPNNGVTGFYATNTTYAYKSMKNGDTFAKKFGGASGNDPDWFLMEVFAYSGGTQKTDTVKFYLADFRSSNNSLDYILKTWQWVDCTKLGAVDSIYFKLTSSDVGMWGMNTPAFFSLDNFTTAQGVGIAESLSLQNINLFPNPAKDFVNIRINTESELHCSIKIYNSIGSLIKSDYFDFSKEKNNYSINLENMSNGLYIAEITADNKKQIIKLIKQ